MSEISIGPMLRILAISATVEIATGLGLVVAPTFVVTMLLGPMDAAAAVPLGRTLGIAMLALGLACWPARSRAVSVPPAFRGMLTYNVLVAAYLAYLGAVGGFAGLLLWPAVVFHTLVACAQIWTWRASARSSI